MAVWLTRFSQFKLPELPNLRRIEVLNGTV
jgi:hypothetical protein